MYLSRLLCLSGSCCFTGGGLEGSVPHGLLLQSEPGAVDAQPPRQPAGAARSQTGAGEQGSGDKRVNDSGIDGL